MRQPLSARDVDIASSNPIANELVKALKKTMALSVAGHRMDLKGAESPLQLPTSPELSTTLKESASASTAKIEAESPRSKDDKPPKVRPSAAPKGALQPKRKNIVKPSKEKAAPVKTLPKGSTVTPSTVAFTARASHTLTPARAKHFTEKSSTFPPPKHLLIGEIWKGFPRPKKLANTTDSSLSPRGANNVTTLPKPKKSPNKEFPLDLPEPETVSENSTVSEAGSIDPSISPKPKNFPRKEFPLSFPEKEEVKKTPLKKIPITLRGKFPEPKKISTKQFPLNFPEPEESVSIASPKNTTVLPVNSPKPKKLLTTVIPLKFIEPEEAATSQGPGADDDFPELTTLPSKHLTADALKSTQTLPPGSDSIDALPSNISSADLGKEILETQAELSSDSSKSGQEEKEVALSEVLRPSDIAGKPLFLAFIRPNKSIVTPRFTVLDRSEKLPSAENSDQALTLALPSGASSKLGEDRSTGPGNIVLNVPLPQLTPLNITISRKTVRKHRKNSYDDSEDSKPLEEKHNENDSAFQQDGSARKSAWKIKMVPKVPLGTASRTPLTKSLNEPKEKSSEPGAKSDSEESIDEPPSAKAEKDDTIVDSTVDPLATRTTPEEADPEDVTAHTLGTSFTGGWMDHTNEPDEVTTSSETQETSIDDPGLLTTTKRSLPEASTPNEDDHVNEDNTEELKATKEEKQSDLPEPPSDGTPYEFDCDKEVDEKGALCKDWAAGGLCSIHRPTMFLFCRKTCLCVGPGL
ncbi:hypothetical protein OESDEN_05429 [Oesophagostomum dentatum]|uniref:ShKT domain-containing protein n=1 Tax=Oesophagostomum dentatum TaxID=61180 RepID=A0A0B1TEZ3_OESDE|nr:hypothetical protein OESDEN_05429 [Oesophagostomum dentatum]